MRTFIAITLVSAGCKGLLGIDDVTLQDASVADASGSDASDAPVVDGAPDAIVDGAPDLCPDTYVTLVDGGRYRIVTQNLPWSSAASACAADTAGANTHLAVISSEAERDTLRALLPATRLWIGLSKRTGQLAWVTAEPAPISVDSPPWQPNEPDGLAQPCVYIEDGLLADDSCGNGRSYLCECDAFADDPSRY